MGKKLLFIAAMAVLLGGCATILSGEKQKLNFTTDTGESYTVLIDGAAHTVPAIIEIERKNEDKILTVEECPDKKILLRKDINPLFFINIITGGVFGSTTDYSSGAMWQYQPDNIDVDCN